ncbi:MAG: hypothetical protein JWO92_1056 [Chitinophagaceae bacterium]|nr:hypothetical protein [Chitinophagaceae bacterium]
MDTAAKTRLLLSYSENFTNTGVKYFSLTEHECAELYYQKMDLFKKQLAQNIPDNETALKMFSELAKSILISHIREKRDKLLWQLKVVSFAEKKPIK